MGAPYEKILAVVLDDPTLTDAEARLMLYLTRRPPGWVVIPAVVARDIKRNERHWVRPTLRLLQARGFIAAIASRGERAQFTAVTYRICREELIAPDQAQTPRSEPSTVKAHAVPPAETAEDQASCQVTPQTVNASTVPPAKTDNPSSDRVRSDRARSDDRRKRTDSKRGLKTTDSLRSSVEGAAKRGTRIPDDFLDQIRADGDCVKWFREHCPDVDRAAAREANDEFFDYWRSVPGARGTKLDWVATWRNRMRRVQLDAARHKPRARRNTKQETLDARAAYLASLEDTERTAIGS